MTMPSVSMKKLFNILVAEVTFLRPPSNTKSR
jgi:hypothetical protein